MEAANQPEEVRCTDRRMLDILITFLKKNAPARAGNISIDNIAGLMSCARGLTELPHYGVAYRIFGFDEEKSKLFYKYQHAAWHEITADGFLDFALTSFTKTKCKYLDVSDFELKAMNDIFPSEPRARRMYNKRFPETVLEY